MAKENKLSPFVLFIIATVLLTAAWLMKPFPVFIFAAFAPLFAITDHVKKENNFWQSSEWILLALCVSLFAAHFFSVDHLLGAVIEGILLTLSFVAYGFAHQSLGERLGKLPILFFWLSIEFLLLKFGWPSDSLFLADAFSLKQSWVKWNVHTGYLGASFWILFCNLVLYYSYFKTAKINWLLLILFLLFVTVPIVFSYWSAEEGISRKAMMVLYQNQSGEVSNIYQQRGEFIPRTATWVSILIMLVAAVKYKVKKK